MERRGGWTVVSVLGDWRSSVRCTQDKNDEVCERDVCM